MNSEINRTEPSPNRTWQPSECCEYISSVCPKGLLGAWMMTCGRSCVSGPLWAPTRAPPLLHAEGNGGLGQVAPHGTTPTHVLSLRIELCSPINTVCDKPSLTETGLI